MKWGVDELSVNPKSILPLRERVRNMDLSQFNTESPKPEAKPELAEPKPEVKAEAPKPKGFFGRLFG